MVLVGKPTHNKTQKCMCPLDRSRRELLCQRTEVILTLSQISPIMHPITSGGGIGGAGGASGGGGTEKCAIKIVHIAKLGFDPELNLLQRCCGKSGRTHVPTHNTVDSFL